MTNASTTTTTRPANTGLHIIRLRPSALADRKAIDLLLRGGAMLQIVGR